MENFTWWSIILAVFGSGGIVFTIIKISSYVSERVDKRRERRALEAAKAVTNAVELHKSNIEAEHIDRQAVVQAIWDVLKEKKLEVEALKLEVRDLRNLNSLTSSVIRQISAKVSEFRRQVDTIDILVKREAEDAVLLKQIEDLRDGLNRLEQALP
jgi:hypothetical protein